MKIDEEKCVGCGNCIPWCTSRAIRFDEEKKKATIDPEECTLCYNCFRTQSLFCPVGAIVETPESEMTEKQKISRAFSDPLAEHKETGIPGRGTEEIKTNEVSGRVEYGKVGIAIEVGRPGVGARLGEVSKIAEALARNHNVTFEEKNPVTFLMVDKKAGKIDEKYHDVKVLSAIIEFVVEEEKVPEILKTLREALSQVDTVATITIGSKVKQPGNIIPVTEIFDNLGIHYRFNGKTNLGLGRPLNNPLNIDVGGEE